MKPSLVVTCSAFAHRYGHEDVDSSLVSKTF